MRKHFLILMLMALLPLAGWAQTADFGQCSVGDYTYGDANLPVPLVKDNQGGTLKPTDGFYTVSNKAYAEQACTTAVNLEDMVAGHTYYLKITGVANTPFAGKSTTVYFTVQKMVLNITTNVDFSRNYNTLPDPDITINDWEAAELKTGEPWNDTKAELGTLAYTYAGKGIQNYDGGEYDITFSGLSSDNYDIKYPSKKFTIVGTDLSGVTNLQVKNGTAFAAKTYKGASYTIADLTGLRIVYGEKELVQGTDFDVTLNYGFSSYNAETNGTWYTDGTVELLRMEGDAAYVKVLQNTNYNEFVGKVFKVTGANSVTRKQLYDGDNFDHATGVWVTVTGIMNAGDHPYNVVFKGNYSGRKDNFGTFTISAAPIVVGVEDIVITYDNANHGNNGGQNPTAINYKGHATYPAVFTYSGLKGVDVASATAASIKNAFTAPTSVIVKDGADAIDAKDYVLTISNDGATNNSNYVFSTWLDGKLTIAQKVLSIKAADKEKAINDPDPEYSIITNNIGLIGDDYITGVTYTRQEGEGIGAFDITPNVSAAKVMRPNGNKAPKDVSGNYDLQVAQEKGKLTIHKRAIVVAIKDANKLYGQQDPTEFAYVVTGLQTGDNLGTVNITREAGETVGNYALTAEVANPDPAKYESLTVVPAIFEIKKAQLIFTIPTQSVAVGATKAALSKATIDVQGINNSDVAADLYDLDFNDNSVDLDTSDPKKTTTNKTYDNGILVTLKAAAQAKYEIKVVANPTANPVTYNYQNYTTGKLIVGTGTGGDVTFSSIDNPAGTTYDAIMAKAGEVVNVTINFNGRNRKINDLQTTPVHTWAKDNWNALILPFDITVAELSHKLGFGTYNYAVVNTVKTNSADGKFQFELVTGTIPANTPFMVKTVGDITDTDNTNAVTGEINFGAKLIKAPAENTVTVELANGYKFVGKYADFVIDKNMPMNANNEGLYRFQYGDDDAKFRTFGPTSTNSWTIVPFDCYVDLSADAAAREVIFEFEEADGSTTAIKSISADVNNNVKNEGWYTINGVKLQSAPSQKGIYIFNGKKLVVK